MEQEKKKQEAVIDGSAVTREKRLKDKFKETFTPEDKGGILEYIVLDVVAPLLKDAAVSAIGGALGMIFYKDATAIDFGRRGITSGHRDYTRPSRDRTDDRRREEPRTKRPTDVTDICFRTKYAAVDVLAALRYRIREYDVASVADFYEAMKHPEWITHVDSDYGWTSIPENTPITEYHGGFYIELPKPRYLY